MCVYDEAGNVTETHEHTVLGASCRFVLYTATTK